MRLPATAGRARPATVAARRSEEHTSELQSQSNLVCRLLLEKKKKKTSISNAAPNIEFNIIHRLCSSNVILSRRYSHRLDVAYHRFRIFSVVNVYSVCRRRV